MLARPHLGLVLAFLCLCACAQGERKRGKCALGTTSEVTSESTLGFDDLALVSVDQGLFAAWSVPRGLFTRKLDARGVSVAPARRVSDRCLGGIALATSRLGTWLACSRPHADESQSEAVLLSLDDQGAAAQRMMLGKVGTLGRGIRLATRGDEVLVAFHDASEDHASIRLAKVRGEQVTEELVSQQTVPAFHPDLEIVNGKWVVVFSETRLSSLTESKTHVVLRREGAPVQKLRAVNVGDPAPTIAKDESSAWLTYRELAPREQKPDLFAVRLTDHFALSGEPNKIGRANSEGSADTFACAGNIVGLLPREYGGEHYVAVHALSEQLSPLDGGHQLYANSREYVRAAGACHKGSVITFAAERAPITEPTAHAMTATFSCP